MVCQLPPDAPVPDWAMQGAWLSLTRTPDELSIIGPDHDYLPGGRVERGWTLFELEGPLDLNATGILSQVSGVLASAGIPVLAVGTFATDYFLVRRPASAADAWVKAGYSVIRASAALTNS